MLKSLTVLDLDGGHIASVSYDSTKPLEQLLADVALSIPEEDGLRACCRSSRGRGQGFADGRPVDRGDDPGPRHGRKKTADGVVDVAVLSLLDDEGEVRSFDLPELAGIEILDEAVRRDLDYYLRTQLSAKKKDARSFTFLAQGEGKRRLRLATASRPRCGRRPTG